MALSFNNRRIPLALRIFLLFSLFFSLSPTFAQVNFVSFRSSRFFFHGSCMHRGYNVFDFYVQDSLVQNAKEDSGGSVDLGRRAKVSIRCLSLCLSFRSVRLDCSENWIECIETGNECFMFVCFLWTDCIEWHREWFDPFSWLGLHRSWTLRRIFREFFDDPCQWG